MARRRKDNTTKVVMARRKIQQYEIAVVRDRGGFVIKMFLNGSLFAESDVIHNLLDALTSFHLDYT